MESLASRKHGLLPLPAVGRFPLTPPLPVGDPLGRGSLAAPQIEFVLITKVCVDMNGTCFRKRHGPLCPAPRMSFSSLG
jgi:hypothetical protein